MYDIALPVLFSVLAPHPPKVVFESPSRSQYATRSACACDVSSAAAVIVKAVMPDFLNLFLNIFHSVNEG